MKPQVLLSSIYWTHKCVGSVKKEQESEKNFTKRHRLQSRVASRAAVEEVDCFLTPVRSRGPPWRSRELLYKTGQDWSPLESLVVDKGEEREVNRCLLDFFACIKIGRCISSARSSIRAMLHGPTKLH